MAHGFPFGTRNDFYEVDEKPISSATANQDQCLVKFTRQYSEDAHKYLVFRGLAPALQQCVQVSSQ